MREELKSNKMSDRSTSTTLLRTTCIRVCAVSALADDVVMCAVNSDEMPPARLASLRPVSDSTGGTLIVDVPAVLTVRLATTVPLGAVTVTAQREMVPVLALQVAEKLRV